MDQKKKLARSFSYLSLLLNIKGQLRLRTTRLRLILAGIQNHTHRLYSNQLNWFRIKYGITNNIREKQQRDFLNYDW